MIPSNPASGPPLRRSPAPRASNAVPQRMTDETTATRPGAGTAKAQTNPRTTPLAAPPGTQRPVNGADRVTVPPEPGAGKAGPQGARAEGGLRPCESHADSDLYVG
jgi:hypothetical protein